jgi:hypothetical protein
LGCRQGWVVVAAGEGELKLDAGRGQELDGELLAGVPGVGGQQLGWVGDGH